MGTEVVKPVARVKTVTWKANATATATTLISNATYLPFGPPNVLTFGNGRTLTKAFDQDYAIDSVASSAATGLKLDFSVDVMGDITQASGTINPTTPDRKYLYDPLYRLGKAQTGAATPSPLETYTYDKTGDRLSASLNGGAATTYTYTTATHRLASVGGVARSYDPNGNTKTGIATGLTFNYDDKNRLATAVKAGSTYTYVTNGRGERVRRAVSGLMSGATVYVHDEAGQLLGEYAGNGGAAQVEYVYLDSTPIAVVKGTSLAYVETDHLGTPRQAVDPATNTALWTWDLLGSTFGVNAANQSPGGGAAYTLNLRYPGQYYDQETNLNYNYFRDYEAGTGRYVESDPIGLVSGLNTYAYVAGNSLRMTDEYGLRAETDLCAGLTPENCANAGGTPYWGWDAHLGYGRGRTSITCKDECGKKHTYIYMKFCGGAAEGLGFALGGADGMDGLNCRPDRYAGWFLEGGVSAGPLGLGVDIGYNEDGPAIPGTTHRFAGSMSGVAEGGMSLGVGAPVKLTYCYYVLIGEK